MSTIWVKPSLQTKDSDSMKINIDDMIRVINIGKYRNKPLFEWIGNEGLTQKIRPFFDLDAEKDAFDEFDPVLEKAIDFICQEFKIKDSELAISTAHRDDKWSCHIIVPTVVIELQQLRDWVSSKKEQLKTLYLDSQVYRTKGLMRICGTSKEGLSAPLIPINGTDDLKDHLITYLSGQEKPYIPTVKVEPSVMKKPIKVTVEQELFSSVVGMVEFETYCLLVDCLKNDDLPYNNWIDVGLCLHNIDPHLKEQWIAFSQKSSKYNEESTLREWEAFKSNENGFKIGSLHYWARRDNPEGYRRIMAESLSGLVFNSASGSTYDVAMIVWTLFKDLFVYAGGGIWYYFKNHRWMLTEHGDYLRQKISTEIYQIVQYWIKKYSQTESKKELVTSLKKTCLKLKDVSFKNRVMDECQSLFFDSDFYKDLDADVELIGFENGVYDLRMGKLRSGLPSDHISLSTGYDYQIYHDDDQIIKELWGLLRKNFPLPIVSGDKYSLLDAVLIIFSSFLRGGNTHQLFYIFSNAGSNGKTLIVTLLELIFGDYSKTVDPTFFTDETKKSSASASPERAELRNIRFIHAEEPNKNDNFNIGKIKEITGNGPIKARALYHEPITFVPQFKPVLSCNHLPKFGGTKSDEFAVWRRIRNITFVSTFVDEDQPEDPEHYVFHKDPTLFDRLRDFRAPFMYLLTGYYRKYVTDGGVPYLISMRMNDAAIRDQADPLYEWFNDSLVVTPSPGDGLTMLEIWNAFKMDRTYFSKTIKKKDIKQFLEGKHLLCLPRKQDGGRQRCGVFPHLTWTDRSEGGGCLTVSELTDVE